MPSERYVLRRIKAPRRYVRDLDEGGGAALTARRKDAWVGTYSSGSEGMDDLERLYGSSGIVEEILAQFERVELP